MFRGTTTTWTASAPRFPFGRSSLWTDASWIYTRPRELATFCESVSKIYNVNDNFNQRSRDSTRAWLKHFLFLTPSYCSSKLRWLSTSHCFNLRYENCFHFVKCFVERDWNYPRDFNKERWINRHTRKGGEEEAPKFTCNWLIIDDDTPNGRSIGFGCVEQSDTHPPSSFPDLLSSAFTLIFVCLGSATSTLTFFDSNTT